MGRDRRYVDVMPFCKDSILRPSCQVLRQVTGQNKSTPHFLLSSLFSSGYGFFLRKLHILEELKAKLLISSGLHVI